jgi:hypothetical protein
MTLIQKETDGGLCNFMNACANIHKIKKPPKQ